MLDDIEETQVGAIGNYYGGLWVKRSREICYWGIENYTGITWQEIPLSLFNELIKERA